MKTFTNQLQKLRMKLNNEKYKNVYITMADHFIWLDVTEQVKDIKRRNELWLVHELFVVHDDESETLVIADDEIETALNNNEKICIEIGFIPNDFLDTIKVDFLHHIMNDDE